MTEQDLAGVWISEGLCFLLPEDKGSPVMWVANRKKADGGPLIDDFRFSGDLKRCDPIIGWCVRDDKICFIHQHTNELRVREVMQLLTGSTNVMIRVTLLNISGCVVREMYKRPEQ